MSNTIAQAAQAQALPVLSFVNALNRDLGGRHLSGAQLTSIFHNDKGGHVTANADGSFKIDTYNVSVGADGSMTMVTLNPVGMGSLTIVLADDNQDGDYSMRSCKLDSSNLTKDQEAVFEEELSNIMENNNVYCHKKKKGGSSGASSGGDNWFIQMAESLGEMLNQMANDVKTATDNVKTKNGQAPFKDSMRVQGLAQQLSFMSQAFMTTLNSIGEAIKTAVTAGGAAR
jgi:hypothetical protein